ncbi:MAG TPA: DUF459 domain-containing protein [Devosiaceae bacterium]|jgi:hypothetical protein|nr:DUF459 domain-containing protein [Devosiaceae bacterium]
MKRIRDLLLYCCTVITVVLLALAGPASAIAAGVDVASPLHVQAAPAEADRLLVAQQQPRKRRTLMDLLFGDDEEAAPQRRAPAREAPVVRRQPAPAAQASLPPAKPAVEKAEGATRVAVFGDSLAVDLSKALERHYAEDPNIAIISQGVGSSGFVRDDFFDWNEAIAEQIAADSFDIAVVIIGINDRQPLSTPSGRADPLTDEWTAAYSARLSQFVTQLRNAGKPTIWVGLPPMEAPSYGQAMNQISEVQKLAVFSGGAEYLDIYERFIDEEGRYSAHGPDLNGNRVRMRRDDGIHFSTAGADKLAFYVGQTMKLYYRGGGSVGLEVADALDGTEAQQMLRPPYQGLGQIRLLEVAGAVIPLTHTQRRAIDLVTAEAATEEVAGFDMELLVAAPVGRADAFGVGISPEAPQRSPGGR